MWLLIVLFVTAGVLSYGFYWGYKKNTRIMKNTAKMLENYFTPAKKHYTWIGGVVGFEADYFLINGKHVHITLLLLPRHSLLYYPFSYLVHKGDRMLIRGRLNMDDIEEKEVIKRLPTGEIVVEMRPSESNIKRIKVL